MKIAEVSAFAQYSVGKIMKDIKYYIDNFTQDECRIYYARGENINASGFYKVGNNFSVNMNALKARIFDNDGFCDKKITNELIRKLKDFEPDIIHIHCLHGYYLNVKTLFNFFEELKNIKIIWTMHDTWAITGHCCFFSSIGCVKWQTECGSCPLKKQYPKSMILDKSRSNFKHKKEIFNSIEPDRMQIIVPSNWLKNIISNSYLSNYNIMTIYNGVNIDLFRPSYNEKEKIILGVASVWDSRKGLDYFIELSSIISKDWKIVLIGKINEPMDFPADIIHIDRTNNQEELIRYYQQAEVFFNPTLDDNYPTVNIEAQLCGTKVLSFDTGGCKETDCGNLYLCESKDIDYVYKRILEIVNYDLKDINVDKGSKIRMAKEYYNVFKSNESEVIFDGN